MSLLSNLVKQAAPIVATFSPDPVTKAIATGATIQYQRQEASYQRKLAEERRRKQEMEFFNGSIGSTFRDPYAGTLIPNQGVSNQGETGFFSTLRSGLRETGGFISDVFASGIPQLFGNGHGRRPGTAIVFRLKRNRMPQNNALFLNSHFRPVLNINP